MLVKPKNRRPVFDPSSMLQHMAMSGSTHKAVGSSPCLDLTNGGTGGGGQNGILSDALRISYIYI